MKKQRKYKIRVGRVIVFLLAVLLTSYFCFFLITKTFQTVENKTVKYDMYISSNTTNTKLYNLEFNEDITIKRGLKVTTSKDIVMNNEQEYYKIEYEGKEYYILVDNLVEDEKNIIKEEEKYVRTALTFYNNSDDISIKGLINKGERLEITGYDYLKSSGEVNMYKVKYNDEEGYVYSKYLVDTKEEAILNYDEENTYKIHAGRTDVFGGGSAANLDYYPYEKVSFEDNKMPDDVRAIYMKASVIGKVDEYIKLAKSSGINAIVVDIKDNTSPAYPAKAMEKYSPTNYKKAINSYETYRQAINKITEAGLYAIGRITVFKDSYYAQDHPENTILDTATSLSYNHDGSFWPSAYNREVWEFNVSLAIESVEEMGFNEIQFDYVRFPDRVSSLEKAGKINYVNVYNEEKAQAIQRFVMYATDELHKHNAYVSIDVFGESAHNYVTAYGQYWPAISNVADVISGMPYPDHFSKYEYGFDTPVWTIPYKLLSVWGKSFVMKRQAEIPTPAVVRTWIQAYDTYKSPSVKYDSYMVSEELKGLYESGLTGGFMTWNGSSSLTKYKEISPAFGKEYGIEEDNSE